MSKCLSSLELVLVETLYTMEHDFPVNVTIRLANAPLLELQPAPASFESLEQEAITAYRLAPPLRFTFQDMDGFSHLVSSAASYTAALGKCSLQGLLLTLQISENVGSHVAAVNAEEGQLVSYQVQSKVLKRFQLPFLNDSCRVVVGSRSLLVAGCNSDCRQCFDVTFSGEVQTQAALPAGRQYHTMCIVQGSVHLACGTNVEHVPSNSAFILQDQWTPLPSLAIARSAASSVEVQGVWYILGGWRPGQSDWENLKTVECYQQGTWTLLAYSLPQPGRLLGLIYLGERQLLVCGVRAYELNLSTGESVRRAAPRDQLFRSSGLRDQDSVYLLNESRLWTYSITRDAWTSS